MAREGWIVPPAKDPSKSDDELRRERAAKVEDLVGQGLLRSERIREAMLRVPREDFIPRRYRDYAYAEVPLPLPGTQATISCPHSYPLFYEPLGLDLGHRFLEIGLGSGYGTGVAREVVGEPGLVVSVEIDPVTFAFGRDNLRRAGYTDVVLVLGDGGKGHLEHAPYDRICLTAACEEVPSPLIRQLRAGGRLIAPIAINSRQRLVVMEKTPRGELERTEVCDVLYVDLRGQYGVGSAGPQDR